MVIESCGESTGCSALGIEELDDDRPGGRREEGPWPDISHRKVEKGSNGGEGMTRLGGKGNAMQPTARAAVVVLDKEDASSE